MPKNLIPDGFVKSSFEYNDERVEGYKYKSNSQFYLIYGMNSETGEKGLYMFDKKEGTVQRFNDEIADIYKDKADLYFMILMIVSGIVGVAIVAMVIVFIIGHVFNLAINTLGSFVHSSRLQYVEFFGKFFEGGGTAFNPFKRRTKYVEIVKEEK